MFKWEMQRTVTFLAVSFIFFSAYTRSVLACGGVTATMADDPQSFGVRTESGPGGTTLRFDKSENVYIAAKEIKISSALAEATAKRYLEKTHKRYEHLEFEAFT